jgi:hypothetical protein
MDDFDRALGASGALSRLRRTSLRRIWLSDEMMLFPYTDRCIGAASHKRSPGAAWPSRMRTFPATCRGTFEASLTCFAEPGISIRQHVHVLSW